MLLLAGSAVCLCGHLSVTAKLEAETWFTGIRHLNDMFGFFNPHALLQSESQNFFTSACKSTYDDEVDFLEL